jgi:hypothetical protein
VGNRAEKSPSRNATIVERINFECDSGESVEGMCLAFRLAGLPLLSMAADGDDFLREGRVVVSFMAGSLFKRRSKEVSDND